MDSLWVFVTHMTHRDPCSVRWAVAIAIVVGLWLVSMLWSVAATANEPPPQIRGVVGSGLLARALHFVESRPDGRHRMRAPGAVDEVRSVVAAADLVERDPWPDAPMLLALAWRESRWRSRVVGTRGELGIAQVMPRYVPHAARDDLHDPQVALFFAAGFLERSHRACGDVGRALRQYATGRCAAPTWSERVILNWAEAMR